MTTKRIGVGFIGSGFNAKFHMLGWKGVRDVFAPAIDAGRARLWARGAATTGRPYLARAAEEHSGPHTPWFWKGELHGGGVLNDMICHSALVVRHLLTKPGDPLATVRPVRITGHIASLKWSRPAYAAKLAKTQPGTNYLETPGEDFASATIEFATSDGYTVFGEVSTSWSFVGAGCGYPPSCSVPSIRWRGTRSTRD